MDHPARGRRLPAREIPERWCAPDDSQQFETLPNGLKRAALVLSAGLAVASGDGRAAAPAATAEFERDIAPVLAARCVECHRPEKAKGGYQLHTWAALMKPGRSGDPPIVAGRPEASLLVRLLEAPDPDDRMPQKAEPLGQREIGLIRLWIENGARPGSHPPDSPLTMISAVAAPQPPPPTRYPRPVPIHALAFSPDGQLLAAGGYHEVTLWDAASGRLRGRVQNVARQVQQLAFSPDGKQLAVAAGTPGRLGEVKLFEPATGRCLHTVVVSRDLMLTVAFSPDGAQLAAGGSDNAVHRIDARTGARLSRHELNADWVLHVAFDRDGRRLVTASRDKTVRILNAATGELEETYAGHAEPVFAAAFLPGADGGRLLSAGRDRTMHLWQVTDAKKLAESPPLPGEIRRLALAGDRVFAGAQSGEVLEYRVAGRKLEFVRILGRHDDAVGALALHEGSGRLASGSHDGQIRIWPVSDVDAPRPGKPRVQFVAAPGL